MTATMRFDPFAPEHRANPHPVYREMRERDPVWLNPETDTYICTRLADCERVLHDPNFSANPVNERDHGVPQGTPSLRDRISEGGDVATMLFLDAPDHTRIRKQFHRLFTPRSVQRLEAGAQQIVDDRLDQLAADGEFDAVHDLGFHLPVTIISDLVGVPEADREPLGPWSADASRALDGDLLTLDESESSLFAFMNLLNYFNGLIEDRQRHAEDDLLSHLIALQADGELSPEELRANVILLFVAGHETTTNLIGNGIKALLEHPDQWARLVADPSLAPSAVEEILRYDGPVHLTGRVATSECEIGGKPVEPGQGVVTLLAAANRDPEKFDDPDSFDIGRKDNNHLTFGHGMHHCLGASLARLEGRVALGTLATRFPDLRLVTTEPRYREHFILRGLSELRVAI